jgi:hypothetical protein
MRAYPDTVPNLFYRRIWLLLISIGYLSFVCTVISANTCQKQDVLTKLVINTWESADEKRRGIELTVKTITQSDILALKRFPVDWQPFETVCPEFRLPSDCFVC